MQRTRRADVTPAPRQFDWEAVRKQIGLNQAALASLDNDTPEALALVWQRRAAQLAQTPAPEASGEQLSVVVIRLQREFYGLEVQYVRDVVQVRAITRVPRVPPWVVGVVTQRGHVVSVIDLQQFIGAEIQQPRDSVPTAGAYLVNVQVGDMEVALLVDEILVLDVIPIDQLHPIESAPRNFRTEFVRGISQRREDHATDLLIVLNSPALLTDKRLIVNEVL
ncbi:MAG TPA: chemotaxis protein CheW [Anaerolineae bacterium]|nr:chemotaxis protein CheW [Anaerolineae bacterium]